MLTENEELGLEQIENLARKNIKGKQFFRVTDILETAFCLSEEQAYDVLKNIMGRKSVSNSTESIIYEYLDMLEKGYCSIKEQLEIMNGDKLFVVKNTIQLREKNFTGGTFFDAMRDVYNIKEEEIPAILMKYLNTIESPTFNFIIDEDSFNKFIETDIDELENQYNRFKEE
ncbi:hypothetical protein [Clostridium sp. BJN0001]|uniref:hypothetical protein n=1 Tax=Clostridium sp. BJN0001 TaxID=2930219 RepID=UPI001FCF8F2B|nr:hypothetical protein [Clostridium sp. BJN0001]